MLVEAQRDGSQRLATEFDAGDLDNEGEDENNKEERVVEEVLEDIDLCFLEFSGVDLVEDLHQDETVEEDGVVLSAFIGPVSRSQAD